ncbi:MAG: hypothetical protein MK207_01870 [Saprospiraceae bacterium]|nr:hypothetical protein [Saprospiraceae bacterium]
MAFKNILLLYFMCLLGNVHLMAQFPETPPLQDSLKNDSSKIDILHISTFKERTTNEGIFRDLIGDVHLKQKEMHLWCDIGFIFPGKQIEAFDNVQMLQDDSIRVFSDSLYYDGISRYAQLRSNVVLKDSSMTLFTEKLNYDLTSRIATFPDESLIESDSSIMVSKQGTYNANTNIAHFEDSVRIDNPNYILTADSLEFNTQTEIAFFLGPTNVYNAEKLVYCEDGFYDTQRNYAELYKNARFENYEEGKREIAKGDTIIYHGDKDIYYLIGNAFYQNEDQEILADTIYIDNKTDEYFFYGNPLFKSRDTIQNQSIKAKFTNYDASLKTMIFRGDVYLAQNNQIITTDSLDYNTETKNGFAQGHVVWLDTSANMQITCGEAFYNDSTKYLLAHINPLLTTVVENDTMWLRSDTLISIPDTSNIDIRNLKAFYGVEVFKSNLQVLCDSMYYNGQDSMFHFYENPILWVDGTQFTADTINVQMKNSKIHRVFLFNNSFIVNTNEDVFYNQVKGRNIVTKFIDGEISTMSVDKNGETVYYALDDLDLYMGVNDVDCEKMLMFFVDNKVNRIRFQVKPSAVFYPMNQVDHTLLKLNGFHWLDSLHIKTKYQFLGLSNPIDLSDTVKRPLMIKDSINLGPNSNKLNSIKENEFIEVSSEKQHESPKNKTLKQDKSNSIRLRKKNK